MVRGIFVSARYPNCANVFVFSLGIYVFHVVAGCYHLSKYSATCDVCRHYALQHALIARFDSLDRVSEPFRLSTGPWV